MNVSKAECMRLARYDSVLIASFLQFMGLHSIIGFSTIYFDEMKNDVALCTVN
ncbi:hypothetical protein [Paenibacillus sp. NPDC057934]|uniref:hypothetical protein n=1 Tax=Paenibacillus sp. NPDC057934 TaxID=3346282 RepID=UPI0036D82646